MLIESQSANRLFKQEVFIMSKNEIIKLDDNSLSTIIRLIESHRQNAFRKVNEELVSLYYEIGKFLSEKISLEKWGNKKIDLLANEIHKRYPSLKGISRPNLYRMIQFYEAYRDNAIVSTLLRQISWSNNVLILSTTKTTLLLNVPLLEVHLH